MPSEQLSLPMAMPLDLMCLTIFQVKSRSAISFSVGARLVTTLSSPSSRALSVSCTKRPPRTLLSSSFSSPFPVSYTHLLTSISLPYTILQTPCLFQPSNPICPAFAQIYCGIFPAAFKNTIFAGLSQSFCPFLLAPYPKKCYDTLKMVFNLCLAYMEE